MPTTQNGFTSWQEEILRQLTELTKDHEIRLRSIEKVISGIIGVSGAIMIIIALIQFLMKKG